MIRSPYEEPTFAADYVRAEVDRSINRYEWAVTYPALLQLLSPAVERTLDYGCGSGIFTAGLALEARRQCNPQAEFVGTDSSNEMLRYAYNLGRTVTGLTFSRWDASTEDSDIQDGTYDRVFAKLVFNYISTEKLAEEVMPRLRACLNDRGLLVAVLPNPVREVGYSASKYTDVDSLDIEVGSFGEQIRATGIHHTMDDVLYASEQAGFKYANIFGLPDIRFVPYKPRVFGKVRTMKIAEPLPLEQYINTAKRWLYVFGTTQDSGNEFDDAINRLSQWRRQVFPEIASVASVLSTKADNSDDRLWPAEDSSQKAMYIYRSEEQSQKNLLVRTAGSGESLSARGKVRLAHRLAKLGIVGSIDIEDFFVTQE